MRSIELIALTGLILAVGTPAWAGNIGSDPPFAGPNDGSVYMQLSNYECSRIYSGYLANGSIPATPDVWYTNPTIELQWTANPYLVPGETAFGVFRIDTVYTGVKVGYCNIQRDYPLEPLWHHGDGGKEIVGIFFGRQDDKVQFAPDNPDPGLRTQLIHASNDNYKVWYQDVNTFNGGVNGITDRFATDKFLTIGYDTSGSPIGELVLEGGSVQCCGMAAEIDVAFSPQSLSGSATSFVEFDTGTPWNENDDEPDMPNDFASCFPFLPGEGGCAHTRWQTTIMAQDTIPNWDMFSADPVTGCVPVPEPSMLSLFLVVSGAGAFLRRRRRRAVLVLL